MTYTSKNKRFSITTEMKQFCFIPSIGITYNRSKISGFNYGIAFMFACVNCVFRFGRSDNNA